MSKHRESTTRTANVAPSDNKHVNWLTVVGAAQNNLKNIDVSIPLGRFVCVTGVSGSGKSSLVRDIIREQLMKDLNGAEQVKPGKHRRIRGKHHLDKVIDIDQSPIGRTPRSNPATYIKLFDEIRNLYARLPDSKVRGHKPGRFSFNVPTGPKGGGRCEACEGNGSNRIEMDFLADVWVTCPVCGGRRFSRETQQILYKGKSIADVLEMDVQQALKHFENIPKIRHKLQTLHDVGLDYLKVGQPSNTLSGGEAQRIKLARELVKRSTGRTLYSLDEPTTGLHFDDIRKLLAVLHGLVDAGNTVLVIEHNLDVIKTADWVIDLGPEGGEAGGRIVAEGTPERVADVRGSYTGRALRRVLGREKGKEKREEKIKRATGFSPRGSAPRDGQFIRVVGAKQHNLKDVSLDIARQKTTVFTGLSGSGKSSLAMDTLYTEGQRRYVESLSAYARQFLGQLQKPAVDHIDGLPPAIAIEQKSAGHSPRSTVGTVTEIYDYLRILYARLGQPYCPNCSEPIGTQTSEEIVDRILALPAGTKALLLAPIERVGSEKYPDLFARERQNGYQRARVDGVIYSLDGDIPVQHRRRHTIELLVDRVIIKPSQRSRITDSVEQSLAVGRGRMKVQIADDKTNREASSRGLQPARIPTYVGTRNEFSFSQLFACNNCGTSYEELTPHHFSFNTRLGWCESCEGLGTQQGASIDAIVTNPSKSVLDGAIFGWDRLDGNPLLRETLRAVIDHLGINPATPWRVLNPQQQRMVLHGVDDGEWIEVEIPSRGLQPARSGNGGDRSKRGTVARTKARGSLKIRVQWKGFFPAIDQATRASWHYRKQLEALVTEISCKVCGGSRLQPLARFVRFGSGKRSLTIHELCSVPLRDALRFLRNLRLDHHQKKVAGELLHEVTSRLQFLVDVGLDYVTLQRSAPTLSGGESQRIRLASQIGSGLTGVLYVLDEPTIGLHPRDNHRLIAALNKLRDWGNTLCIVEHDRDVIRSADCVLDFGPGAGRDGGQIVAQKSPEAITKDRRSLTGKYLSGKRYIPIPTNRRAVTLRKAHGLHAHGLQSVGSGEKCLHVLGARHNNLRDIDVSFPLGRFIAVTGVSGSGKSSLVNDILYKALASRIQRARLTPGSHDDIVGLEHVDKVINVDQSPIGQTPSSNPATYTKVFDVIRELFAKLTESKIRGYTTRRFSFNRPGGRCEECLGLGEICIEMHFMPDVWITCEECNGRRYNLETLEVKYKGQSIADVLEMRVAEAAEHFKNVPKVRAILQTLVDVGLGYIQLGQSATTLSGGEAQRVKLAAELARTSTGKTVYILDEPTTGLHFDDLRKLLDVLHRLVDLGNTVICIEHNMDLIKTADWIIDVGPEAGDGGGRVVVADTPERVAKRKRSHTGKILAEVLAGGRCAERRVFSIEEAAKRQATIAGKLELASAETEVKLPWEKNGRRWHTQQCLASGGERPRWEPDALLWLVNQIEETANKTLRKGAAGFDPRERSKTQRAAGFSPRDSSSAKRPSERDSFVTDWNHRSRVELRGPGSKPAAWFCHILTRGPWLLECTFRVARRSFDARTLADELGLKTLDEREDLPIYGQWRRVKRRVRREFDDIRIMIHDLAEINTPAFRRFLKSAVGGYLKTIGQWQDDPELAEPWKVDGRTWHISQKAIAPNRRKMWKPSLLVELVGRLNKLVPDLKLDWNHKTAVVLKHPAMDKPWGKIVTANRYGLRVELRAQRGQFTPAKIDRLGPDPEIKRHQNYDWIMFTLQSMDQIDTQQLKAVLLEAEESLLDERLVCSS